MIGVRFRKILMITLVVLALAPAQPAEAIAHGVDAPDGDYPFSVRLTMTGIPTADQGTRDSWCSGALISPRWVITAGHCFRDANGQRVSRTVATRTVATIGRTDLGDRNGHEVDIVAVHQSPTADVSLAELNTPVTDIEPLRIGTTAPTVGETVRLTGYGLTADIAAAAPTRLQTGQFIVNRVSDSIVAMSGRDPRKDTSACLHDSGGPYFRETPEPELVAVVSTGPSCPHVGPDFSARTDNLHDWVTETINTRTAFPVRFAATALTLAVFLLAAVLVIRWVRTGRRSPRR